MDSQGPEGKLGTEPCCAYLPCLGQQGDGIDLLEEDPMPDMTTTVSGQTPGDTIRTQPVDCAYLHNAFGPGCPYCRPTAGAERLRGPAGQRHALLGDR